MSLNQEQHRNRHVTLHHMFDELWADFIAHHPDNFEMDKVTVGELVRWSHRQTTKPDHEAGADEGSGGDPA